MVLSLCTRMCALSKPFSQAMRQSPKPVRCMPSTTALSSNTPGAVGQQRMREALLLSGKRKGRSSPQGWPHPRRETVGDPAGADQLVLRGLAAMADQLALARSKVEAVIPTGDAALGEAGGFSGKAHATRAGN
ncbi:hypothetical protein FQR65_LT20788 [Abscondita terminalis]|nr:hypothetical protein FQR65_LT20788 [Abscondita terminalis]